MGRPGSTYALAAAILIVLNLLDLLLTRAALDAGAQELNPISRFLLDHAVLAFTVKLTIPVLVLVLAFSETARAKVNDVHVAAIWTIVGIYLMTVFINTVTLLRYS
jgi:hypothetical protein